MARRASSFAEVLILVGGCLFIAVLWLSAYLEPDIRWLHFFQAWMYIAAIVLSLRHNRWGYFIGFSAAALWDYINLFVTTFLKSGLHWMSVSITSGQWQRLDQMVAVPGWLGNFLVIVGAIWAYARLPEKRWSDAGRVASSIIVTTGFFAAAMAICQPRYLPLFKAMFHPHRPW
jgi:hypothetical protein